MFDKNEFSHILKKINATYDTMSEFGKTASFDRTYISKYINKKLDNPPSPKILKKIANASNGITTYNELMFLCGYTNNYQNDDIYYDKEKVFNNCLTQLIDIGLNSKQIETLKHICLFDTRNDNSNISISDFVITLPNDIQNNVLKFYDDFLNNIFFKSEESCASNTMFSSASVFVYGTIPAGVPMECIEDIIDTEDISLDMLKGGKKYFGLKVKGDSMFPEYLDGDTLILEKVDDCESGQDCVVMVNGNDGTFKRVFKNESGIILQPLNNTYQPMIYTNEQIETLPIRIIGKVVELRRKK